MLSTPTDTTCIRCTIVLENELQYHGLAVRINSRDNGATSFKKFGELLPGNSRDDRAYL